MARRNVIVAIALAIAMLSPLSARATTLRASSVQRSKASVQVVADDGPVNHAGIGLTIPIALTLVFGFGLVAGLVLDQRDTVRRR